MIEDEDNLPDHVADQDGNETDDLEIVSDRATVTAGANDGEYVLSVTASREGWVYGVMHDPTNCTMNLVRAVRNSDGADVTQNIWQTDRTVTSDYTTIVDNRLHWADNIGVTSGSPVETYTLYYEPKPAVAPQVKSIALLPGEGQEESKATKALVTFKDPIDEDTFDADDLVLMVGSHRYTLTLTPQGNNSFVADWGDNRLYTGNATLTVFTSDIFNSEGTAGTANKVLRWTAAVDYKQGDANGDNKINVGDVMAIYSYILEDEPQDFVPEAADLNGDGLINVADIFKLYELILEQE